MTHQSILLQYHQAYQSPGIDMPQSFKESFEQATPLSDMFPHEFENELLIESFNCQCSKCSYAMAPQQTRGHIEKMPTYIIIKAFAWCPNCQVMERVHVRINDQWNVRIEQAPKQWSNINIIDEAKNNHIGFFQKLITKIFH